MGFQPGNKLGKGHGRKGFDYEQEELDRMKKILKTYFTLVEKKKLTPEDEKKFIRYEKLALKILDKRHANKTDMKVEIDKPLLILDIE